MPHIFFIFENTKPITIDEALVLTICTVLIFLTIGVIK